MRVLMVCPRFPPVRCGVGDYTALLARHLAPLGMDVVVVTSRRGGSGSGAARRMEREDTWTEGGRAAVWATMPDWGWRSLPRLCSIALSGRFDLVHVQYQNEMYGRSASIAALPLALRLARPRLPVVVTVHDYGTPWSRRLRVRALAGPYGKAWFAAMLLAASRVVLTNEQDEWRFMRQRPRYPVPAARYVTIPVGSNLPTAVTPARLAGHGEIVVGYFGFVNPAKGVDTLLEGFERAWQERPMLRLVMVCALRPDDSYHAGLLERIRGADWVNAVAVTGEREDAEAAALLAGCEIVALPFRDGISLRRTTLMAALALGRAVVSTEAAVVPEALRDGREVALVPPSDAEALGRALVELADDPARRAALGAAGQTAAAAFTWPSIAARTAALYRAVIA